VSREFTQPQYFLLIEGNAIQRPAIQALTEGRDEAKEAAQPE
jgi:hypothetical protein